MLSGEIAPKNSHYYYYMCMVWPYTCFVDDLSYKCINVHEKGKKVILINHDCLPILMVPYIMLHIMLAYLMLLAALSNAVFLYNAFFFFFFIDFCKFFFMLCLALLTHILFISSMIYYHAQCF